MHASSSENMQKCFDRYVDGEFLEGREMVYLLDVGATDINGSYRQIFAHPKIVYIGADMVEAEGVDLLLSDPYHIPLADNSLDLVVCGQMLEHCEFFWLSFQEMVRVLKPDGYLFLIAPSAGPEHRFPVDCYRFYPDAFRGLAKHARCRLVDLWHDERGPWCDLVGVFSKAYPFPKASVTCTTPSRPVDRPVPAAGLELEVTRGSRSYLDVLAECHVELAPRLYLEIGVRRGDSLALATGPAIGVDPRPELARPLPETVMVFAETSDHFFEISAARAISDPIDLAFIDGLHHFEFALRDFMAVERRAHPTTLVVIDDIFPNHPAQAERERRTAHWSGDVWKLMDVLVKRRPDLVILPLDAAPAGVLLVTALDPDNRVLWHQYNPLCGHYRRDDLLPPPAVLSRKGAIGASNSVITEGLRTLRALRAGQARPADVSAALTAWRTVGSTVAKPSDRTS
jgi:hypothetical protein